MYESVFFEVITEGPLEGSRVDSEDDTSYSTGSEPRSFVLLKRELLLELRAGLSEQTSDIDAARILLDLIQNELTMYGTYGGNKLNDEELELVLRTFKVVLRRLGCRVEFEFRNFTTFRSRWVETGMVGTGAYEARRSYIERQLFAPREFIEVLEDNKLTRSLRPHGAVITSESWFEVDTEISELVRKFEAATTSQDYRALGTNCVGTLEALGRAVFDADSMNAGESIPVDRIIPRLEAFMNTYASGSTNTELRSCVRSTATLAHRLKHRSNPTVAMAGVAAEAVIALTNIVKRISEQGAFEEVFDEQPF